MKKFLLIFICLAFLSTGCASNKTINGVEYDTYGLFNEGETRNPNIRYRIVVGNVIWSVILIETIAFPVYFIGFSMWNLLE